jgi:hypothetical protein
MRGILVGPELCLNLMTVFKKILELQVTASAVLLLLLLAVYDSYEIDIEEMEPHWVDEEDEDTGEK